MKERFALLIVGFAPFWRENWTQKCITLFCKKQKRENRSFKKVKRAKSLSSLFLKKQQEQRTRANHYHLYLLKRAKERFALFCQKLAIGTQKTKSEFPTLAIPFPISCYSNLSSYPSFLFCLSFYPCSFAYLSFLPFLSICISFHFCLSSSPSSSVYLYLISSSLYLSSFFFFLSISPFLSCLSILFSSFDSLFLPLLYMYPSFLFCTSIPSSSSVYLSLLSLLSTFPTVFCLSRLLHTL